METAYRMVEWTWTEWRGRYDIVERSEFVDRPYQRYPRSFILPPSIEFSLSEDIAGNLLIVTPEIQFVPDNYETIIHTVNLFLEIFRECEVFSGELKSIRRPGIRQLNWEILPPGRYPWDRLQEHVLEVIHDAPEGNRVLIEDRLETINLYEPEFHVVGKVGFRGYVVFGYPEKRLYVFENACTGNATYVFGENWETLSKLTKTQILDENLQLARLIHRKGWHASIRELLG